MSLFLLVCFCCPFCLTWPLFLIFFFIYFHSLSHHIILWLSLYGLLPNTAPNDSYLWSYIKQTSSAGGAEWSGNLVGKHFPPVGGIPCGHNSVAGTAVVHFVGLALGRRVGVTLDSNCIPPGLALSFTFGQAAWLQSCLVSRADHPVDDYVLDILRMSLWATLPWELSSPENK